MVDRDVMPSLLRRFSLFLLPLCVALPFASDARTWTSTRGTTVEAEYVRMERGMIVLRKTDGGVLSIRATDLSPGDQQYIQQLTGPSPANQPGVPAAQITGTSMMLGDVELKPGVRIEFQAPLSAEQVKWASSEGNMKPDYARAVIALPEGFDPTKPYPILIVSQTSDGDASSVNHHQEYWETAIAHGWIALAADGPEKPASDHNGWRLAMISATLDYLQKNWPQLRTWPVASGGFSGGSKRSGYMGAALCKDGYNVIGMFMGGCNDDMASKGLASFKPSRWDFLKVPIYLSNGKADDVAPVSSGERTKAQMEKTGFKNVRAEVCEGGHSLNREQLGAALDWFLAMSMKAK